MNSRSPDSPDTPVAVTAIAHFKRSLSIQAYGLMQREGDNIRTLQQLAEVYGDLDTLDRQFRIEAELPHNPRWPDWVVRYGN